MSTPTDDKVSNAPLVWRGVWSLKPSPVYREGHVVADTDLLSLWVADVPNPKKEVPGTGTNWRRLSVADLGGSLVKLHAGAWDAATKYAPGSLVTDKGSSFIAKKESTGVEPPNADSWAPLADKGEQGIQGVPGEKGEKGDKGDEGDTATSGAALATTAPLALVDETDTAVPVELSPGSQLVDVEVSDGGVKVNVAGTWEFVATVAVTSAAPAPGVEYTVDTWFQWGDIKSPVVSASGAAGVGLQFVNRADFSWILTEGAVVKLFCRSVQSDPETDPKPAVSANTSVSLLMRRVKKATG